MPTEGVKQVGTGAPPDWSGGRMLRERVRGPGVALRAGGISPE